MDLSSIVFRGQLDAWNYDRELWQALLIRKTLQMGTDALQLAIPGPEPVVVRDREKLHALL